MSDDAPPPTSAARSEDIVPDRARPDPSADALADQGLAERLALAIDLFIDPAVWIDPGPPPETLALALIDTAYAPGASHRIVEGIQRRYRQWAVEHRDEFLADLGGPEGILRLFGPGPEATVHIGGVTRHVLTRHTLYGRPKDQMLREAAEVLMGLRILDLEDLRRLDSRPGEDEWLTAVWCSQRGLGQGTLAHLKVLAGVRPFVLTDTVRRWLAGALRELGGRAGQRAGSPRRRPRRRAGHPAGRPSPRGSGGLPDGGRERDPSRAGTHDGAAPEGRRDPGPRAPRGGVSARSRADRPGISGRSPPRAPREPSSAPVRAPTNAGAGRTSGRRS